MATIIILGAVGIIIAGYAIYEVFLDRKKGWRIKFAVAALAFAATAYGFFSQIGEKKASEE